MNLSPLHDRPGWIILPGQEHLVGSAAVPVSIYDVVRLSVAADRGVDAALFHRHDREVALVEARHVAMWLMRSLAGWSLPMIGRRIGRHHASVLHGIRHVEARREADPAFRARLDALAELIRDRLPDSDLMPRPEPVAAAPVTPFPKASR